MQPHRLSPFLPHLVLITNSELLDTKKNMPIFEAALAGGVDAILLRERNMASSKLLAVAAQLRVLTTQYQAKLLVHSHADIAQAVSADGVHLSTKNMSEIVYMKAWLQQDMLFSVSCHDLNELTQAKSYGANFAFLSPVFATKSHPKAPSLGIATFKQYAEKSPLPVVALGGIELDNRHLLTGYAVASIRSLLLASNPQQAAHLMKKG